jgi:hypothetical protein
MATIQEMLKIAGTVQEAEKFARNLIKIKGPEYLLDLSLLLSIQGKFDESKDAIKKALENNPNDVRAKFNLGWHFLRDGKLLEGFKLLNEGRIFDSFGNRPLNTDKPIWDGSSGHHLLFSCEGGFGDQIIFVRFAKEIADLGYKVVISCSTELMDLFSGFDIPVVDSRVCTNVYHDYWIPSFGLPVIMKYEYDDINGKPYINPKDDKVKKFSKIIKTKKPLKVGIKWSGNEQFEHQQFRRFPPDLLFNILRNDNIEVYSLQYDEDAPDDFIDLSPFLKDWSDTAGVIANMDIIISSCTGVAHLSAAMGKPTLIIVPIMPYFIWANRGDKSPWYDSVTLFRQTKFEEWNDVFDKISYYLEYLLPQS